MKIELDAHEVRDGDEVWFCEVIAEVEVVSGCDDGGPWSDSTVIECEAECVRVDAKGNEMETKKIEGQAAIDFVGEYELIKRAEEAHH